MHDVGAVDADKTVGGKLLHQRFQAHERQDGMRFVLDVDLHVVLQLLNIENPLQFDLLQLGFRDAFSLRRSLLRFHDENTDAKNI